MPDSPKTPGQVRSKSNAALASSGGGLRVDTEVDDEWTEGLHAATRDKFDFNNDGVVDNEEYIAGMEQGITSPEGDTVLNMAPKGDDWKDEDVEWTPRTVFDALEARQEAEKLLLPQAVPGFCHAVAEYAVSPLEPWRLQWNVLVLGVVLYSAVQVPYTATFKPLAQTDLLDYLVDLIFYVDMGLNFFTGFDRGYEIVLEKRLIVWNYVSGWFAIDLAATVDWDTFASMFFEPEDLPSWVELLALLKILRLARASRLIDALSSKWDTHSGYVEAGKFFMYVFVVGHLLACFFFMWPILVGEDTWLMGSSECSHNTDASSAARNCIENGGVDENGDECDIFSAVGWFYKGSCMQGSWREQQGLEQICLPLVCGGSADDGWEYAFDKSWTIWHGSSWDFMTMCEDGSPARALTDNETTHTLLECMDTMELGTHQSDPGFRSCPRCMRPIRLYIDSMYWSLTTMTTIGYGDRGPKTESEILYALFAEIFGLAFFALLLTQINYVNDLLGLSTQQMKNTKDGVLQFLSQRMCEDELIEEVVKFLSFRNSSFSGNSIADNDDMKALSEGMRARIRSAVYLPVLKKITFFGWDTADDVEELNVKSFFDRIDESGDGRLDKDEIGQLFASLGLKLSKEHFQIAYGELDRNDTGSVDFIEFSWWWFKTKYGVPRVSSGVKCPEAFLMALAGFLQPKMYCEGDRLVKEDEYGGNFVILLSGKLRILRPGVRPGLPRSRPTDRDRVTRRDRFVDFDDREPMFGFSACLTKLQYDLVRNRTDHWAVDAMAYCDTLWCSRKNFYECFSDFWLKGRADMVEMAYYHYEVSLILNAQTKMDGDDDGEVSHQEFLDASAKIPHGFATHFAEEQKAVINEAKEKGLHVKGSLDVGSLHHQEQVEVDNTATAESLMETEELLAVKVRKLDSVAKALESDVASIQQGFKKLLRHHDLGWEEENPALGLYEGEEPEDEELVLRVKAGKQSNVTKMERVNKSDSAGDGRGAVSPGTFEEEEGQKKKKPGNGKGRPKKKR